eukprot:scaffold4518_cov410-Prasinococcus_capsulatus_cf.AAC.13
MDSRERMSYLPSLRLCERAKPTFCFEKPGSMTYTIPSIVRDVSAMFVDTTILRPAGPSGVRGWGAASNIRVCWCGGNVEYSGSTSVGPT